MHVFETSLSTLSTPLVAAPSPPLLYLREQHADDHNRYLHFFGTTLVLAYAASEPLLLVAATMAVVVGLNVYELTYMVRQKVELGKNLA